MSILHFILLLLAICTQATSTSEDKELIMVIELARHGARSPEMDDTTHLNVTWDIGRGELTDIGQRQHYLIGRKIRHKYIEEDELLPEQYDPKSIYVRSTNFNRTLMSAHSQLMGIYPLGTGKNFTSDARRLKAEPPYSIDPSSQQIKAKKEVLIYNYNPIPVHTVDRNVDYLLRSFQNCPINSDTYKTDVEEATEKYDGQLQPLYQELVDKFDVPSSEMTLEGAYPYIDSWTMAKADNRILDANLSSEAEALIPKHYEYLHYDGYFKDSYVGKLTSTRLYNYIIDIFNEKLLIKRENKVGSDFAKYIKFVLFSAHDSTILAFLTGLGHYDLPFPPLASTIFIELYRLGDEFYLKLDYNNITIDVGKECISGNCQVDSALKYLKSRTVKNIEKACTTRDERRPNEFPLWAIITMVVIGMLLLGAVVGLCSWLITRKPKEDDYEDISDEISDEDEEADYRTYRFGVND